MTETPLPPHAGTSGTEDAAPAAGFPGMAGSQYGAGAQPGSYPPPVTGYRRLTRSRTQRTIAGVCGGIAEYFQLDPVLVRLLFVVFAFFTGGTGLLAYPVLWLVVPEAGEPATAWSPMQPAAPTAGTAPTNPGTPTGA